MRSLAMLAVVAASCSSSKKKRPVKKAMKAARAKPFPFRMKARDYLGQRFEKLRKSFPHGEVNNWPAPDVFTLTLTSGKLVFKFDRTLRIGSCRTGGSGSRGKYFTYCLELFFRKGQCVLVVETPGVRFGPYNGRIYEKKKTIGDFLSKPLAMIKPPPDKGASSYQANLVFSTAEHIVWFGGVGIGVSKTDSTAIEKMPVIRYSIGLRRALVQSP